MSASTPSPVMAETACTGWPRAAPREAAAPAAPGRSILLTATTLGRGARGGAWRPQAVAPLHPTQVRLQRGEGVVGDLGAGGRHPGYQGALAGVGEPDDGRVGGELECQRALRLLAR